MESGSIEYCYQILFYFERLSAVSIVLIIWSVIYSYVKADAVNKCLKGTEFLQ